MSDIQVSAPCTKMCCMDSRIYQLQNNSILIKENKNIIGKNAGKRTLNPDWFNNYSWLHVCLSLMKVYCTSLLNFKIISTKVASKLMVMVN